MMMMMMIVIISLLLIYLIILPYFNAYLISHTPYTSRREAIGEFFSVAADDTDRQKRARLRVSKRGKIRGQNELW